MCVIEKLIQVESVELLGGHRVRIAFDDGLTGQLDLSDYLTYGPVFEPLKEEAFFKQVRIEGGTLAWPNGADIAPERLYERLNAARK